MVKFENLFKIEKLEDVVKGGNNNFFVTLGAPNYEERSISCLKDINKYARTHDVVEKAKYELLLLTNRKNSNIVLDELKTRYKSDLKRDLIASGVSSNWYEVTYPNNFNFRGLITQLSHKLKKYSAKGEFGFHIDISAMPRGVIFTLCEALSSWLDDDAIKINNVYFSYVSPQEFSQLPYAQEVGLICGFFAGRPIAVKQQQDIRAVIFPSMTGHESKLLLDELNQIEQKNAVFLQIDANDFLTSMEIMRANQILMEQGGSTMYYYCSPYDAIKEMVDYFHKEESERINFSPRSKRLYLVAPFGAKIMLPVSYFTLKKLKESDKRDLLDIEVCHAQGFQYTSVYSIGVGETCTFSLNIDKWKQK